MSSGESAHGAGEIDAAPLDLGRHGQPQPVLRAVPLHLVVEGAKPQALVRADGGTTTHHGDPRLKALLLSA